METESKKWKLGDDVSADDNILDGFTFRDLILAVHCNCENITPEAVRREAAEILEERMQDYRFLLRNNIEEIMAEAKKGRAQYEYGRDHENGKPWGVEALVQRLRSFRFCN